MTPDSATKLGPRSRVRFTTKSPFTAALKAAVDGYLQDCGKQPTGDLRLHLKAAAMFAWLAGSYTLLLIAPLSAWQASLLAVSLGLAMAGVGFNVMHDANHGSFSRSHRVNRLVGFSLDLLGGSSYLWRQKHNVLHHTYTNISAVDDDIEGNVLLRFAPSRPRRPWHRFQHVYVWLLFAVYPYAWWLFNDFRRAVTGRIGGNRVPRPRGRELTYFVAGKAVFFAWAFVVPALAHRSWAVVPLTFLAVATLGVTLATVFQLAHCVGEADFPDAAVTQRSSPDWAVHQVATTVDFARGSRLLSWYLGGLNFQIEHHLFPKVSHVHYAALAPLIERVCREHGVQYRAYSSLVTAIVANVRWLRRLGTPAVAGS